MKPVIWLLGLSGSGKTALGSLLRMHLESCGHDVEFVDEDAFCRTHGLEVATPADRQAVVNAIRDHVIQQKAQGKLCVVAATTPTSAMRKKNRQEIPFYREVWVRCGLKTLVERDPKGLYARACDGFVAALPGLSEAFDEPSCPHLVLDTDIHDLGECYIRLCDMADEELDKGKAWQYLTQDMPVDDDMPIEHTAGYWF